MFIKIRTPVTVTGLGRIVPNQIVALTGAEAIPLIKTGAAVPRYGLAAKKEKDDELERLKEKARRAGQNVDWAEQERFKRKAHAVTATASGSWQTNESFEAKIVKATKALAAASPYTRKAHEERAERERKRYRKPQRRQPCKGE